MSPFAQLLERHGRATLFFSAGKDSLACLLLMRAFLGRIDVVWCNPGAPHPAVAAYMDAIRSAVPSFIELKGDQPAWVREHGWPVDVLPVRSTRFGEIGAGPAPVGFAPYTDCCWANLWAPMKQHLTVTGTTLVIMGQRREESMRNRLRDEALQDVDGITYWQPINEWPEAAVLGYIKAQGAELPPFYADGATSSCDCWNCTAYLDHNVGRLAHMKAAEPDRFAVVSAVLEALATAQQRDIAPLHSILENQHG